LPTRKSHNHDQLFLRISIAHKSDASGYYISLCIISYSLMNYFYYYSAISLCIFSHFAVCFAFYLFFGSVPNFDLEKQKQPFFSKFSDYGNFLDLTTC
jgi:hypothetical protein